MGEGDAVHFFMAKLKGVHRAYLNPSLHQREKELLRADVVYCLPRDPGARFLLLLNSEPILYSPQTSIHLALTLPGA